MFNSKFTASMIGLLLSIIAHHASAADQQVTLLVPGIKIDLGSDELVWGQPTDQLGKVTWNGMIGGLQQAGYRFGGIIRPKGRELRLAGTLDTTSACGRPIDANLFALEFSPGANVDGLAYKTLELATALAELRNFTGARRVNLVTYSAAGLVARCYLQNALPSVDYAGDVSRLITFSVPHLGSTQAAHLGDFLGTRATSIKPNSDLIRQLNNELSLPRNVLYASLIVRGKRVGATGLHVRHERAYSNFVNRKQLSRLPLDYQKGGDQVVDVWSQNLWLSKAAREYEQSTGRPVQYCVLRVDDPTPEDRSLSEERVHAVAPRDAGVISAVTRLLADTGPWYGLSQDDYAAVVARQARLSAFGLVENQMALRHAFSEVVATDIDHLRSKGQSASGHWRFEFSGSAESRWRLKRDKGDIETFTGSIAIQVDRYGRVTDFRGSVW